jgi:hypothetical protein
MWTERTGLAAALATINKHRDARVGDHLMAIGKLVQEGWRESASKNVLNIHIGGIPPLSHFTFQYDNALAMKALFVQLMLEKGFLASTLFYAMFAHQDCHVKEYLKAVDETFSIISKVNQTGDVEKLLIGLPAGTGFKRFA